MGIHCINMGSLKYTNVPFGIWNNLALAIYSILVGFTMVENTLSILSSTITLLAYSIVCIAISYTATEEGSFEWVLKVLVALALVCSIYTLFFGVEWDRYGITMSKTNNPHNLAGVLNLGIFATAYMNRNKENKFSFISFILMMLFILVTIKCGSRKYLVANALIVTAWALAALKDKLSNEDKNQKILAVLIFIMFATVVYFISHDIFLSSNSYNRMQSNMDQGNQNRLWMYEKAWEIFLDHPIFGGGFNQFRYWSGTGGYSHSTYAEAIADFGVVGCTLYFLPILTVTCRLIRKCLNSERNYGNFVLLSFCILELFIGVGQIFFMEFHHFLVWTMLFFYAQTTDCSRNEASLLSAHKHIYKYIK